MNPLRFLKIARAEKRMSDVFPVTHLNAPQVFETHTGMLGAVLGVEGAPYVSESPEKLNMLSNTLHHAICQLDERFIINVTMHRKPVRAQLDGNFSSPFARHVNDKYHARFRNSALYKNHLYITVLLKETSDDKSQKVISWFGRMFASRQINRKITREQGMNTLLSVTEQLKTSLGRFKPWRLGDMDESKGYSELLAFLSLVPNAGEFIPFQSARSFPVIATSIPDTFKKRTLYPEGHLGQYLCSKRVLVGEYIQFQGASRNDRRYGVMLSIKKYPKATSSVVLDPILAMDCECIVTHSFAPLSRENALSSIDRQRGLLTSAEDLGTSQIDALAGLEDAIASEEALLGFHHNTVMLLASDIGTLESAIHHAVRAYGASGTTLLKEAFGAELAFLAQIPGNHAFIARASQITSENFVDFCPLHNTQTGFVNENHLGSAVTLLETPAKTPVFFNWHRKGSRTNPVNGHSIVFGPTDAGKTTLVAFLDSQMNRYGGRSFFLDRDQASRIHVLAMGNGSYTCIKPENAGKIQMNPLQMPDTPDNRTFLKTWMGALVRKPDETDLPASIKNEINECINYCFEQLEQPFRTLGNIVKILPGNFERREELKPWIKGNGHTDDGEFHWLFDNPADALETGFDRMGFDITWLMDSASELVSTPVYLYLVHRMRQCLDGRLTTIYIDEAFQVFRSEFWKKLLLYWLPTIRKYNGHFVFMTQSPESVVNSALRPLILANIASMILFPNPTAERKIYCDSLKLSESLYQSVITTPANVRLFLYRQDQEVIVCKLDLSSLPEEVRIFSGNENSNKLLDTVLEEVGEKPDMWIPVFTERSAA